MLRLSIRRPQSKRAVQKMRSALLSMSMRAPLLARQAIPHPHHIRNNASINLKRPPSVQFRQRHVSSAGSVAAASATPVAPKAESGVVVVVGGGIIGLSTAQELLQRGHRVITVTKSGSPQNTTSAVAAGFVFPYLLKPISKCEEWVKLTVDHCKNPPKPELVGPLKAFAIHVQERVDGEPEWGQCGLDYRRMDASELADFNKKREGWLPAIDGFVVETFWINTPAYLDWLVEDIKGMGGKLLPNKELSSLMDVTSDADICSSGGTNEVKAIVNCTGVYARSFVGDKDLYPMYGQVISLKPQAGIDDGYVVEDGADLMGGHTYMFPRCVFYPWLLEKAICLFSAALMRMLSFRIAAADCCLNLPHHRTSSQGRQDNLRRDSDCRQVERRT